MPWSGAMADCDAEVRIGAVAKVVGTAIHTRPRRRRTRRTLAAAVVWPDGAVTRAEGVVRVDRVGAGRYCVVVADHVDWRRSVPVVSLQPACGTRRSPWRRRPRSPAVTTRTT